MGVSLDEGELRWGPPSGVLSALCFLLFLALSVLFGKHGAAGSGRLQSISQGSSVHFQLQGRVGGRLGEVRNGLEGCGQGSTGGAGNEPSHGD